MEIIRTYDSVEEFTRAARAPSSCALARASRTNPASPKWDFGAGMEGALRLVEAGWEEGAQRIKEVLDKVAEILRPKTFEQEVRYDVTGAFIDIGMYLNGEPNCFGNFSPPERVRKPIRVIVNCAASAAIPASAMMHRGAAIAAAIDVLEREGYRVELDLITVWQKSYRFPDRGSYISIIRAKDTDQPVDLDRIAFCVAHSAFLRRICFGAYETENEEVRRYFGFYTGAGYSYPGDSRPDGCELYFRKTFAGEERNFATAELSAEWVKRALGKAGLVDFDSSTEGR